LTELLAGNAADLSSPTEITGFELPDGAPTWGFEVLDLNTESELPNIKSFIDRTSALALVAGKRALAEAGLLETAKRPEGLSIGCAYGTMMGCLEAMGIFWSKVKTGNPKFAQPLPFTQGYANSPSSLLCIEFGLHGPSATFSGERLAGAEALQFACDQIASGAGDAVLVCASESLTQAAWNHFQNGSLLSARGDFSDGTVLGEGGVALLLEFEESALARRAPILGTLAWLQIGHDAPLEPDLCACGERVVAREAGDLLAADPLLAVAVGVRTGQAEIRSRSNRFQARIKKS
jgi:3-oxoacyl-(acyl-carrier-protein) synthase